MMVETEPATSTPFYGENNKDWPVITNSYWIRHTFQVACKYKTMMMETEPAISKEQILTFIKIDLTTLYNIISWFTSIIVNSPIRLKLHAP